MKFKLSKLDQEKLIKLIDTNYYNSDIANFINENIIGNSFTNEIFNDIKIDKLNISLFINDSYINNIKSNDIKFNNYKLCYEKYTPQQMFLYDEMDVNKDDYYLVNNKIGYFEHKFNYLTIQKDNIIWMSTIPHEINTMKNIINKANGDIFVFGLGLGYFPYHCSLKSNVTSITIIDNDNDLVNLFKTHLFPSFINKDKYKFIIDDAFNYLEKIDKNKFIFIDLWHNESDGLLTYIKLKRKLKDYPNVYYWIENSLINALRNLLITLIEEEYNNININYSIAKNDTDKIINALHNYLMNKTFNNYEEIKNFLDTDNLRSLVINLNI